MKLSIYALFAVAGMATSLLVPTRTLATRGQGGDFSQNKFGIARTVSSNGFIDTRGPFFQNLGSNGRTCNSCHVEGQGWGISAEDVKRRFDETDGKDPIFRTNDGSNSP